MKKLKVFENQQSDFKDYLVKSVKSSFPELELLPSTKDSELKFAKSGDNKENLVLSIKGINDISFFCDGKDRPKYSKFIDDLEEF